MLALSLLLNAFPFYNRYPKKKFTISFEFRLPNAHFRVLENRLQYHENYSHRSQLCRARQRVK